MEGIARDMIRFIQQMRKDAGLNIKDLMLITFCISTSLKVVSIAGFCVKFVYC